MSYVKAFKYKTHEFEYFSGSIFEISRYLDSVYFVFLIYAFFTVIPLLIVFYLERNLYFVICYISLPFFFIESFSVIRQEVALSFCILGYYYYLKRSLKAFIPISIAVGFHYSAVVFFAIVIVLWFGNRLVNALIIFFLVFLAFYFNDIVSLLIPYFPTLAFYKAGSSFGIFSIVATFLLFIISLNKNDKSEHYYLIFAGLVLNVIVINIDSALARLSWYFYIPFCFLTWTHYFFNVKIGKWFFLLIMLAFYSYSLFLKSSLEQGAFLPYRTIMGV